MSNTKPNQTTNMSNTKPNQTTNMSNTKPNQTTKQANADLGDKVALASFVVGAIISSIGVIIFS